MNHRGCLGGGCRLRSNPKDETICLAEDDHQLQNPRLVSPRTVTGHPEVVAACVAEDGCWLRKWKEHGGPYAPTAGIRESLV